jgi:hypothetical protein
MRPDICASVNPETPNTNPEFIHQREVPYHTLIHSGMFFERKPRLDAAATGVHSSAASGKNAHPSLFPHEHPRIPSQGVV